MSGEPTEVFMKQYVKGKKGRPTTQCLNANCISNAPNRVILREEGHVKCVNCEWNQPVSGTVDGKPYVWKKSKHVAIGGLDEGVREGDDGQSDYGENDGEGDDWSQSDASEDKGVVVGNNPYSGPNDLSEDVSIVASERVVSGIGILICSPTTTCTCVL